MKLFLDFFFIRPTDPTFRVEGDGKRNILLGWPNNHIHVEHILNPVVFKNICRLDIGLFNNSIFMMILKQCLKFFLSEFCHQIKITRVFNFSMNFESNARTWYTIDTLFLRLILLHFFYVYNLNKHWNSHSLHFLTFTYKRSRRIPSQYLDSVSKSIFPREYKSNKTAQAAQSRSIPEPCLPGTSPLSVFCHSKQNAWENLNFRVLKLSLSNCSAWIISRSLSAI